MTRLHTDPVEVLRSGGDPARFLWHDRLYVVREVLGHWVETGEWWQHARSRAAVVTTGEREVWRVEAGAGRSAPLGVYDLSLDAGAGTWTLARTAD
ncbi:MULTISPECIES: DUF6504 family protein [Embleya]|uniref:DUF6504 domain-containing protein n=1 Tax=Embleya hyalina TaxID=516124 RepID=A0A401YNN8_9ACTN|nr:DUF6504 family protein [Embleya hyalina]GCD96234.1 hypothetical protein EHYA_03919 [Embleya hyalina]